MKSAREGDVLWTPERARVRPRLRDYCDWLAAERGLEFGDYEALWQWSVRDLEGFWGSIWEYFGVRASAPYERVLGSREMPGAQWFPGAMLNYAEHLLGEERDRDRVAVIARSQTREPFELTFGELSERIGAARAGLLALGVGPGDRVAGYLPNIPETLIAFAASASIGAVWCSCAPELGVRATVDRFSQVAPKILLAVPGYRYGERAIDRVAEVRAVSDALPSVERVIEVPYGPGSIPGALRWEDLLVSGGALEFTPVPFEHPLYVLFSSGTTGIPKPIVHGHGGILLEHLKAHALCWDLGPESRLQWFTTTSWMMWNALVSSLLLGASIVMLDGNPAYPDLDAQWRSAAELGATTVGFSPAFIMACRSAAITPGRDHDLSGIHHVIAAGSPLPLEGFVWMYEQLAPDALLNVASGGTDVCSGILGGGPWQAVYAGEMSGRLLGVAADAYDPEGKPIVGELGELVITEPMPSMPVGFWNDTSGERYRDAYFDMYPGIWRHGDWVRFTQRGSCIVSGRSDATLNRGGVRLGTSEIYAVVEDLDAVRDSVAVHLEDAGGGSGTLVLCVVLDEGVELDDGLRARIATTLRSELSPRHVPDLILAVPGVPRTLTGKKLEVPVKRVLLGALPGEVAEPGALVDPGALEAYVGLREVVASAAQGAVA